MSTQEEQAAWKPLSKLPNVRVIKAEHLLTCVLRQELAIRPEDRLQ